MLGIEVPVDKPNLNGMYRKVRVENTRTGMVSVLLISAYTRVRPHHMRGMILDPVPVWGGIERRKEPRTHTLTEIQLVALRVATTWRTDHDYGFMLCRTWRRILEGDNTYSRALRAEFRAVFQSAAEGTDLNHEFVSMREGIPVW